MIIVIVSVITARKRNLGQGNMFTGVCLSTEGGAWSGGSGLLWGGGAYSRGVPGPGGGCLVWEGLLPGGACSQWGGEGVCLVGTPRDGYCCGRYASYWNAFLLHKSQPKSEASCVVPLKLGLLRDPVK